MIEHIQQHYNLGNETSRLAYFTMIQGLTAQLSDQKNRALILGYLEKIEKDETLVGASSHYAVITRK